MPFIIEPDTPANRRLVQAVVARDLEEMTAAVLHGADPNLALPARHQPLLSLALMRGNEPTVDRLLDLGARPEKGYRGGVFKNTEFYPWSDPWGVAVRMCSPEVVQRWLDRYETLRTTTFLVRGLFALSLSDRNGEVATWGVLMDAIKRAPDRDKYKGTEAAELFQHLAHGDRSERLAQLGEALPFLKASPIAMARALREAVEYNAERSVSWLLAQGANPHLTVRRHNHDSWKASSAEQAVASNRTHLIHVLANAQPKAWNHNAWVRDMTLALVHQNRRTFDALWYANPLTPDERRNILGGRLPSPMSGRETLADRTAFEWVVAGSEARRILPFVDRLLKLGFNPNLPAGDAGLGHALLDRGDTRHDGVSAVIATLKRLRQAGLDLERDNGRGQNVLDRAEKRGGDMARWARRERALRVAGRLTEAICAANPAPRRVRL